MLELPGLNLSLPRDSRDAVSLGLIAEDVVVECGALSVRFPPWFTSRGRLLPSGLLVGTWTACLHFAGSMSHFVVAALLILLTGLIFGWVMWWALALAAILILASVVIHEAGHLIAYRLLAGPRAPAVAVASGARCHVIRLRLSPPRDLLIIIAGPIAPMGTAVCALPLWGQASFVVLIAVLIAAGHAVALLIPLGDGASLREVLGRP
jgi:hypothetical protein